MEKFQGLLLTVASSFPSSLITNRRFVTASSEKIQNNFLFGCPLGQKRWFLRRNARNAAAVLFFQNQRSKRRSSARFPNATLQMPQQRYCCETSAQKAAVVFIFRNQRWKDRGSVSFSKAALETPRQRYFFETSTRNAFAVLIFQKQDSKQLSRIVF